MAFPLSGILPLGGRAMMGPSSMLPGISGPAPTASPGASPYDAILAELEANRQSPLPVNTPGALPTVLTTLLSAIGAGFGGDPRLGLGILSQQFEKARQNEMANREMAREDFLESLKVKLARAQSRSVAEREMALAKERTRRAQITAAGKVKAAGAKKDERKPLTPAQYNKAIGQLGNVDQWLDMHLAGAGRPGKNWSEMNGMTVEEVEAGVARFLDSWRNDPELAAFVQKTIMPKLDKIHKQIRKQEEEARKMEQVTTKPSIFNPAR